MSEIRFDFEWVDPQGARGPELRATWARLAIWLDSRCITRVLDQDVKSVRDAIYLPLYPIAEWLATRWWFLLTEVPSPDRVADPRYTERHSFSAARDGFALPSASISGEGDHIRIRWHREALPNYRIEFVEEGTAHVPIESFRRALAAFIAAVVDRLESQGIGGTFLQNEWATFQTLNDEEKAFCEVAAALGLDPFAIDTNIESRVIQATQTVPQELLRDFFSVASIGYLPEEAADVSEAYMSAQSNEIVLASVVELRQELCRGERSHAVSPWSRGYQAAQRVRDEIGKAKEPLPSFDAIAEALRVGNGRLQTSVVSMPHSTGVYDAVVAINRHHSPSFALSTRHSNTAQRFHFCRGLYEFLLADDAGPWLVTKSLSDKQKESRAFAAEFLAPAKALRERVSGRTVSTDEVDDIAGEFGVSAYVISHQLENHDIALVLPS